MIKRLFIFIMLALMAIIFFNLASNYKENSSLSKLGHYYVENGPREIGAPNLVTAIVVTYRGLDTLGEVTVLFISAAGVGLLLRRSRRRDEEEGSDEDKERGPHQRSASAGTSFTTEEVEQPGFYTHSIRKVTNDDFH